MDDDGSGHGHLGPPGLVPGGMSSVENVLEVDGSFDDGVVIRRGRPEDLQKLMDFQLDMAHLTEKRQLNTNDLMRGVKTIVEDTTGANGFYLVAIKNGAICGCLMVTFEWSDWNGANYWWIQSVFVSEHVRRQGIYRRMYEKVKDMAIAEKAAPVIRLYVERYNMDAQKVYESLGMRPSPYLIYEDHLFSGGHHHEAPPPPPTSVALGEPGSSSSSSSSSSSNNNHHHQHHHHHHQHLSHNLNNDSSGNNNNNNNDVPSSQSSDLFRMAQAITQDPLSDPNDQPKKRAKIMHKSMGGETTQYNLEGKSLFRARSYWNEGAFAQIRKSAHDPLHMLDHEQTHKIPRRTRCILCCEICVNPKHHQHNQAHARQGRKSPARYTEGCYGCEKSSGFFTFLCREPRFDNDPRYKEYHGMSCVQIHHSDMPYPKLDCCSAERPNTDRPEQRSAETIISGKPRPPVNQ